MFTLSAKWQAVVVKLPERGMDYTIVTVHLKNGEKREGIMVRGCMYIDPTYIYNHDQRDFLESDIQDITIF